MSAQEDSVEISETIKQLIYDIVAENNIKSTCKIKYYPGSQEGDGFATKTYAVDITDDEISLNLFVKFAFESTIPAMNSLYAFEIYFYKTVCPIYTAFWKNKGVKDGFRNIPKCYGLDESPGKETIVLENLRRKGYTMFDKLTFMNDEHLKLTLRSFAKFHAISFALKDQQEDLHNEFCERCPNIGCQTDILPKMLSGFTKHFVDKLNAEEEKDMSDKCSELVSKVYNHVKNMEENLTGYAIFTKGDCWVNNLMVLYENGDKEHPIDVMLVDWQCVVRASPVHDIEALFYSVASRETLDNHKHYMEIYYEELSKQIKQLGSDPDILYPYSVFENEWIYYGLHALGLAMGLIKVMLLKEGQVPNLDNTGNENEAINMFSDVSYDEKEYMIRSKRLIHHMIDIKVL